MRRVLVTILCVIFTVPLQAFAEEDTVLAVAEPRILFSEIMANPLDESTGEFIELINNSEEAVDLNGWFLNDLVDTKDTVKDYVGSFDLGTSGTVLAPHAYALMVDADYVGEYNDLIETHVDHDHLLMLTVDDSSLGNGLGNSSDTLTLKNSDASYSVSHAWSSDAGNGISWSGYSVGQESETWKKSLQTEGSTPGFSNNVAPQAVLSKTSDKGEAPFVVTFDASDSSDPEGLPLHFMFDFGDGENLLQDSAIFSHTYTGVGDYDAKLTVTDSEGVTSEVHEAIHVAPKVVPIPCSLIVSEVLPNPTGDDTTSEFIEIQNTANTVCNLSGYKIDDADGGSAPYVFADQTLAAHTYLAVFSNTSHITLNNSGDSARILSSTDAVLSSIPYTNSKEGQSFALNGTVFAWTTTVTPNAQNAFTSSAPDDNPDDQNPPTDPEDSEDPLQLSTIHDAKELEKGDDVLVEGYIIAKAGTLSSQYLYVHDGTAGIQVYSSKKIFPKVKLGQKVRVMGTVSKTSNLKRILVHEKEDIEVLADSKNVKSIFKKTGKITSKDEGNLVMVSGVVEKKVGTSAIINDGSGSLVVSFRDGSGLKASALTTGKGATVQGIITVSNDQIEILPRAVSDVKTASLLQPKFSGKLPRAGVGTPTMVAITGTLGIFFFGLFQLFCARRSKTLASASSKKSGKNLGASISSCDFI